VISVATQRSAATPRSRPTDTVQRTHRTKPEDRPRCPTCLQYAPRRRVMWCNPFGHRCEHDEPCPAWSGLEGTCGECVAEVHRGR
jgi:hypothetical protein